MGKYKSRATRAGEEAGAWTALAAELREAETAEAANAVMEKFSKDEFESLKEEMESWRDNMSSANMEHLPKYDEVSEACDTLDSVDIEDLDDKTFEAGDGFESDRDEAADALETAASELEGVNFPGMY